MATSSRRKTRSTDQALVDIRGRASKQSTNVRALARFASNSTCQTAQLGFAARVDFDTLLLGTKFEAPFGQSPFAINRGNQFEERLRANDYEALRGVFLESRGQDIPFRYIANVREPGFPSPAVLEKRATTTEKLIGEIVRRLKTAPHLIDGAVLTRTIGGQLSFFEADAVAARVSDLTICAGEIKSFPTVDGQADPDKVGAALAQVAIYVLLLRDLVERLKGDPSMVTTEALLITPRNTGLQATMTVKDVSREVERARRILDAVPSFDEVVARTPAVLSFDEVTQGEGRTEESRIEAAHCIVETVGTTFKSTCLSSCGLARFCRDRAYRSGDPARFGGAVQRVLPGIASLDRVRELAQGGKPRAAEAEIAAELVRARALLVQFAPPSPQPKVSKKRAGAARATADRGLQ